MTDSQKIYVIAHREVRYHGSSRFVSFADFHKIGISENPQKRLKVLNGGTPHQLELVTTLTSDDAKAVEGYLHRILRAGFKDRGEWFRLNYNNLNSLEALEHIKAKNAKLVAYNWGRLDRYVSLYVAIHRARDDELPTMEELLA